MLKKLAVVGIPISFQELMVRISFLYLAAVMNRCRGICGLGGGHQQQIRCVAMLSATSMASALAAITAQNMGAGQPQRARRSLWYGLGFALAVSAGFWLWAQLAAEHDRPVQPGCRGYCRGRALFSGMQLRLHAGERGVLPERLFERAPKNRVDHGELQRGRTLPAYAAGISVWHIFSDDLGMLGMVAPIVSGIMAGYTLVYVLAEGRMARARNAAH